MRLNGCVFLTPKQDRSRFSPTPSNCNRGCAHDFSLLQPNSLRLSVSAGNLTHDRTRNRPTHPPRIAAPRDAMKQELHDARTKTISRGDAETQRKGNTRKYSQRLCASAGKSPHYRTRNRSLLLLGSRHPAPQCNGNSTTQ